jgi:hypothetical protein
MAQVVSRRPFAAEARILNIILKLLRHHTSFRRIRSVRRFPDVVTVTWIWLGHEPFLYRCLHSIKTEIFRRRKSSFGGPEVESRIAESGLYSGCWMTSAFILSMMSAVTRAACRRALWSERTSLERSSLTLYIFDVTSDCCSSPVKINWQALGPVESQEPRWLFFSC